MGKRRKNRNQQVDPQIKKIMLSVPLPDDRPNWAEWDRHEVMMSVTMEYVPENFENDYLAVICPVAKRRIVVSFYGWACSYNKLLTMDRKFQSALPGGNVQSMQVIKSNDMCILDCLHLKAERTFYILDLMHWKQHPYYHSEAEFRFHWIDQIENEMDLTTVHPQNEYKFRSMPRIPCSQEKLHEALENCSFRVDGLLFFHKNATYIPGVSPNVLWLPPEDIERLLGWVPPEKVLPKGKKSKGQENPTPGAATVTSEAPASTSSSQVSSSFAGPSVVASAAAASAVGVNAPSQVYVPLGSS